MLSKRKKLYQANTNSAWALCPALPMGTLREIFVASQFAHAHALQYPAEGGDFIVDDRWLFDVRRPGKTGRHIEGHGDAYLVLDDIEHGRGAVGAVLCCGCSGICIEGSLALQGASMAHSSTANPGTRKNSRALLVMTTLSSAMAWAAIIKSMPPMGFPARSRAARICA